VSSPKLDLTEYQTGYRHHLTVQFSEFDITTFDADFWIADTLQLSVIWFIRDKLEICQILTKKRESHNL
jgi:hypothetical protein